ncbi:hypothetical protein Terro_4355 [Terriglobus roseus DSM 18391]|uniref:DUF2062 domain-containing protein n=1 Tax=Terriglobus roseus (strain DSM 18391 / NRRL B-41598 / KBS 63) TaxID=926566 RepID=I3ZMT4_TERRK|nr:DUF2062 domain-containing protein [Terriglobus roseus]AFL90552.1 hypothetical protein Terro_4355 [Terriglobus roseus DSM 18391]
MLIPESMREICRRKLLRPLLCLLRDGISTRRMAWSLAIGMVIGVNPSIGITTLLVVLLAWLFGLNQVASQIGTHVVAPFHLLLFLPFIEAGVFLFRTRHMPFSKQQIEHLSHHPLRMVQEIWQWQWHALIIWAVVAAVVTPLLALYLRRMLVMFLRQHKTLLHSVPATH